MGTTFEYSRLEIFNGIPLVISLHRIGGLWLTSVDIIYFMEIGSFEPLFSLHLRLQLIIESASSLLLLFRVYWLKRLFLLLVLSEEIVLVEVGETIELFGVAILLERRQFHFLVDIETLI